MSLEKMYIVWICAAVLFGIFEALTVQLVSVWFVIGAVAALLPVQSFTCKSLSLLRFRF